MIFLHSFDNDQPKFPRIYDRASYPIPCIITDQTLATNWLLTIYPFSVYNLPHEDKRGNFKRLGLGWG
jgi:hypothetical protein